MTCAQHYIFFNNLLPVQETEENIYFLFFSHSLSTEAAKLIVFINYTTTFLKYIPYRFEFWFLLKLAFFQAFAPQIR